MMGDGIGPKGIAWAGRNGGGMGEWEWDFGVGLGGLGVR